LERLKYARFLESHQSVFSLVCLVLEQLDQVLQQWQLFYTHSPISDGRLHLGKENPTPQPALFNKLKPKSQQHSSPQVKQVFCGHFKLKCSPKIWIGKRIF
jgi:hypothetical protein